MKRDYVQGPSSAKNLKAVLCDIDGTLIPLDDHIKLVRLTLENMGIPLNLADEDFKTKVFGYRSSQWFRMLFPERAKDYDSFRQLRAKTLSANQNLVSILPTVKETIDWLKKRGYKIGAVTTGDKLTVNEVLKITRFPIDVVVTSDDVRNVKPNQEGIVLACTKLGVRPYETIMIGDDVFDIQAGKNAGVMKTIGITTGKYDREGLKTANPDHIIDRFSELRGIIEEM
jgi:pyrophosphatase PpaX